MNPSHKWDESDRTRLRTYVSDHQSFMEHLTHKRGEIKVGATLEAQALNSAEIAGYERCLKTIDAMSASHPRGDVNEVVETVEN